jgi:diguanylate cyclase (GGDEF)-like protein
MEQQLLSSISDTRENYLINQEFNSNLQVRMDGISDSFGFSRTLAEIRNLVFSKIQSIKEALQDKRKEDELWLQSVNLKMDNLQQNLQSMKKEIHQMHAKTKSLEQEVSLDSLTKIHNRRAYQLRIHEELQRFHRYRQVFSLILFDVDHFKQVNDLYGHRAGDNCLKEIINRIKPSLRKSDFLARYGGEEFIIILPGTEKTKACLAAEKIRRLIENTTFLYQGQQIPVTISLGVTQVEPGDKEPEGLFMRVDAAMYQAKKMGRNKVQALYLR